MYAAVPQKKNNGEFVTILTLNKTTDRLREDLVPAPFLSGERTKK